MAIARLVDRPADVAHALRTANVEGAWRMNFDKLAAWIENDMASAPPFSVFVRGNDKLPFWAFSTLPAIDCPGAGACLSFCYSFKAWRYPAAFCRQLQNALLMRHRPEHVAAAWARLGHGMTVRLYVDGDIADARALRFWMYACAMRPDLRVYGYSKSWSIFLAHHAQGQAWPANYMLNLSSGSKYDEATQAAMQALPIVRGTFTAVKTATRANYKEGHEAQHKAHLAELREAGRKALGTAKVFACPGRCGDCMPQGEHACGSARMTGIAVVIATH
jgi:hypothetical protein